MRYTQTTNYKRVNNTYKLIPKRRNNFGKSYESVGRIIDQSFMYFVFGENEKCALMCKHRRKSQAMFQPF